MDFPRLLINVADFDLLRTGNYIYVDKTQFIVDLFNSDRRVFLSRPRRFGKSLMIHTLKNLYLGKKNLFKGLAIEKHLDDPLFQKHPVIRVDFSRISTCDGFTVTENDLRQLILDIAEDHGLRPEGTSIACLFGSLIKNLANRDGKVVILVDEYDRLLVDAYEDRDLHGKVAELLRDFYSQIKECDEYIHIAYITGISKFTKTGIFSAADNITDCSTYGRLAAMFGLTLEEIINNFKPYINDAEESLQISSGDFLAKLKSYYDGYAFSKNDSVTVCNPIAILEFFYHKKFDNYWCKTGDDDFVKHYMKNAKLTIVDLEHYAVTVGQIEMPGEVTQSLAPALYLYQAGYLTPRKEVNGYDGYYLTYPNLEVRSSMINQTEYDFFIAAQWEEKSRTIYRNLMNCMKNEDYVGLLAIFNTFFSEMLHNDYDIASKDSSHLECFYRNDIYRLLKYANLDIWLEEHKLFGRVNSVLYHGGKQIFLELNVSKTGTKGSLQESYREVKAHMDGCIHSYKNPFPIGIVVSGPLHRIALASVNTDVFECPPDADGREVASFKRIGDIDGFLASIREAPGDGNGR